MQDDLVFIRQAIYNLHPLGVEEWEAFASGIVVREYAKGEFLIREGQVEQHVYFFNRGSCRNYFLRDGKDFTVDFHFAGEFVTAYYSLITREVSSVFIELLEDSQIVVVSLELLKGFYERSHDGERIGRLIAEYQYVRRLRKEMDLLSKTAEERYAALLERSPDLVGQLSVKHLSSYLGVQPESLSRIRRALSRGN